MNPKNLRTEIRNALMRLEPAIPYSMAAENLLCMTAAHESNCGEFLYQQGGPALGVFQMEPATLADHYRWMKDRRPLLALVEALRPPALNPEQALPGCIPYAAAMARVHYYRRPEPLPKTEDFEGMDRYAKQHYNTRLGAAKPGDYLKGYARYFT